MRLLLIYIILILNSFTICSQTNKFDLSGMVIDSSNVPLSFASIYLLEPEDSSLIDYTRAEENGSFSFKNISPKNIYLKLIILDTCLYKYKWTLPALVLI